jgi:hypothetical protein
MKKDRFAINMTLRHPSLDPSEVSRAFDLQPIFSLKAGSRVGEVLQKWSVWHGLLTQGAGSDEYKEGLKKAILHIESRQEWLRDSLGDEGELEVTFGFYTDLNDGLLCESQFYPELLLRLSKLNAGMKVQVGRMTTKRERQVEPASRSLRG